MRMYTYMQPSLHSTCSVYLGTCLLAFARNGPQAAAQGSSRDIPESDPLAASTADLGELLHHRGDLLRGPIRPHGLQHRRQSLRGGRVGAAAPPAADSALGTSGGKGASGERSGRCARVLRCQALDPTPSPTQLKKHVLGWMWSCPREVIDEWSGGDLSCRRGPSEKGSRTAA